MTPARGFTLIEMLVALAIFAMVSAVSFTGIMVMIDNRERVADHADRLAAVQTAVALLERDLQQAVARPIRDPMGDPRAAMLSDDLAALEFTRSGRSNPLGVRRSELERVAYRIEDDTLVRLSWDALDQPPEPPRRDRALLDGATDISLRFMDDDAQWRPTWPPAGALPGSPQLPRAVEITITLDDMDTITRVLGLVDTPAQARAAPEVTP
ncbi:type II secretion system minor pseudopilin GspJ [Aquisalimonas asiatica]|uniref:Type II secretion system protein J n=1 Tax=Aquisalimonas asiatica TaxID=406100 RepID=A0A1H8VLW6_9GAMM|nr:type II secretion system minor pseudopilin GspJ [Aquisalimonas asiatica]SEP16177.1 general secretion pathway protein J [Aquisalimonas asiatica]